MSFPVYDVDTASGAHTPRVLSFSHALPQGPIRLLKDQLLRLAAHDLTHIPSSVAKPITGSPEEVMNGAGLAPLNELRATARWLSLPSPSRLSNSGGSDSEPPMLTSVEQAVQWLDAAVATTLCSKSTTGYCVNTPVEVVYSVSFVRNGSVQNTPSAGNDNVSTCGNPLIAHPPALPGCGSNVKVRALLSLGHITLPSSSANNTSRNNSVSSVSHVQDIVLPSLSSNANSHGHSSSASASASVSANPEAIAWALKQVSAPAPVPANANADSSAGVPNSSAVTQLWPALDNNTSDVVADKHGTADGASAVRGNNAWAVVYPPSLALAQLHSTPNSSSNSNISSSVHASGADATASGESTETAAHTAVARALGVHTAQLRALAASVSAAMDTPLDLSSMTSDLQQAIEAKDRARAADAAVAVLHVAWVSSSAAATANTAASRASTPDLSDCNSNSNSDSNSVRATEKNAAAKSALFLPTLTEMLARGASVSQSAAASATAAAQSEVLRSLKPLHPHPLSRLEQLLRAGGARLLRLPLPRALPGAVVATVTADGAVSTPAAAMTATVTALPSLASAAQGGVLRTGANGSAAANAATVAPIIFSNDNPSASGVSSATIANANGAQNVRTPAASVSAATPAGSAPLPRSHSQQSHSLSQQQQQQHQQQPVLSVCSDSIAGAFIASRSFPRDVPRAALPPAALVSAALTGPAALAIARAHSALTTLCPALPLARSCDSLHSANQTATAAVGLAVSGGGQESCWVPAPAVSAPGSRYWPLAPRHLLPTLPFVDLGFVPAWALATAAAVQNSDSNTNPVNVVAEASSIVTAAVEGSVEVIPARIAVESSAANASSVVSLPLLKPAAKKAGGAIVCQYCANNDGGNTTTNDDDEDEEVLCYPVFASEYITPTPQILATLSNTNSAHATSASAKPAPGSGSVGVKFSFARSNRAGADATAAAAAADRSSFTTGSSSNGAIAGSGNDSSRGSTGGASGSSGAGSEWASELPFDVCVGYRCSNPHCPDATAAAAAAAAAAPTLGCAVSALLARTLELRARAATLFYSKLLPLIAPRLANTYSDSNAEAVSLCGGRVSVRATHVALLSRALRAAPFFLAGKPFPASISARAAAAAAHADDDTGARRDVGAALRALLCDANDLLEEANDALGASHFLFTLLHADIAVLTAITAPVSDNKPHTGAGAGAGAGSHSGSTGPGASAGAGDHGTGAVAELAPGRAPVDAASSARYARDVAEELCSDVPAGPLLARTATHDLHSLSSADGKDTGVSAQELLGVRSTAAGAVAALRLLTVTLLARAWQGTAAVEAAQSEYGQWWPAGAAAAAMTAPSRGSTAGLGGAAAAALGKAVTAPFVVAACSACPRSHRHARFFVYNGPGVSASSAEATVGAVNVGRGRWVELALSPALHRQRDISALPDASLLPQTLARLAAAPCLCHSTFTRAQNAQQSTVMSGLGVDAGDAYSRSTSGVTSSSAAALGASPELLEAPLGWRLFASLVPAVSDDSIPAPGTLSGLSSASTTGAVAGAGAAGAGATGIGGAGMHTGSFRALAQALGAQQQQHN